MHSQTLTKSAASDASTRLHDEALQAGIERAANALCRRQNADGHWRFELEADATIPAEYILLEHYLDGSIRRCRRASPSTCWKYRASTAAGRCSRRRLRPVRQREGLLCAEVPRPQPGGCAHGAGANGNPGGRRGPSGPRVHPHQLALFGQVPWGAIPTMPVEIMLLPEWFFFHLSKVSYWSRTVIVPLLVLMTLQPRAANPRGVHIRELFTRPPEHIRDYIRGPYRSYWGHAFKVLDIALKRGGRFFPAQGAGARHRAGGGVRDRAAERRGRAGRHLPRHGQQRDDVRRPRLRAGPPRRRAGLAVGPQADRRRRRARLRAALRLADLGHRTCRRGDGRSRLRLRPVRHRRAHTGGGGQRLAGGPADPRREG